MRNLGLRGAVWILIGLLSTFMVACSSGATENTVDPVDPAPGSAEETVTEPVEIAAEETPTPRADEEPVEEPTELANSAPADAEGEGDTAEEIAPATEEPANKDDSDLTASESTEDEAAAEPVSESAETDGSAEAGILTTDDRYDFLREITTDWNTNWERRTIPYSELIPGQLRDRIRSIDAPTFESLDSAAAWLTDNEPVLVVELNGVARAYPLQILLLHEIVNDVVGDQPVAITYCPLCNSAVVFDRRFNGQVLEFGTSGLLRYSDLVMYDRTTESLWQQFTGEGLVGDLAGERLTLLPSSLVSFANFRGAFPDGEVLSQDTGFPFSYGLNPYVGYDTSQNPLSQGGTFPLFGGEVDERLDGVERVVSIIFDDGNAIAYPVTTLQSVGVINDTPGGHDVVVFHIPGTNSPMDTDLVATGRDVGATGVFDPKLDGQRLTFSMNGESIVDDQTGSVWNILGQAVEGSLSGNVLTPILHGDHFWFSWAAFFPDTGIYGQ